MENWKEEHNWGLVVLFSILVACIGIPSCTNLQLASLAAYNKCVEQTAKPSECALANRNN